MLFTSPQFLFFLIVVCGLNLVVSGRQRKLLFLAASLFFVGTFNITSLIAVMFFTTFTFLAGNYLSRKKNDFIFYLALAVNACAIILFNYIIGSKDYLTFSFNAIDFRVGYFLLVAGLSFYNLQHIAYLVDVYKKRIPAETNYPDFLLVSIYFPKFISGPLTLYQQLRPQLQNSRPSNEHLIQGFNRILLGFFKKLVIADRLSPSVNSVFDYNDDLPGLTVITGAVLFTIQLYFDFSGYCDIAIGVSKMLGIELPENFDFPLRATSITIFWRKWHRTLINFFATYIFYPVSFRFRKLKKQSAAIGVFLTFFVSAIWHGIGFTFMIWALCHMCYLLFELYFLKNNREGHGSILKRTASAFAVLLLVSFSNIFFRSTTATNCLHLLSNLFSPKFFPESWQVNFIAPIAVGGHQIEHFNLICTMAFLLLFLIFERKVFALLNSTKFNIGLTFIMILIIFLFGVFDNGQRFIYMQF